MQSGSPPRKKLKQARLPFQVLSPKKKDQEHLSCSASRKRPLSETTDSHSTSVKLFKSADDSKENKSLKSTSNSTHSKHESTGGGDTDDVLSKLPDVMIVEETPSDKEKNTLGKNKEDSCILDCEDLDSAQEAAETRVSDSKKQFLPFESSSPSKDHSLNACAISESLLSHSDSKIDCCKNSEVPNIKEPTCIASDIEEKNVSSDKRTSQNSEQKPVEVTQDVNSVREGKSDSKQTVGLLAQKTYDMFARWRKVSDGIEIGQCKYSPEKAVEAVEAIKVGSESKDCCSVPAVTAASCLNSEVEVKKSDDIHDMESIAETDSFENQGRKVNADECSSPDVIELADECLSPHSKSNIGSPHTPKTLTKTPLRRLTPKQMEREKERKRKQEEKEKIKLEKQMEKKRLKDEKDEQRKKEREEKEELKRKEKEEKEKKRQAEIDQKNEEKKRRDELKAEEKKKKEEEKKKAEEEEERKKARASAMFTSFFVPKPMKIDKEETPQALPSSQNFMPFQMKADMRVAPNIRVDFDYCSKKKLDEILDCENSDLNTKNLYLDNLRKRELIPRSYPKTWPLEDSKDDDVCVLEQDDAGVFIAQKKREKMRAKLLQFHENQRPAYWGTWRKNSTDVSGRRPFGHEKTLDYEVDSDDEWEEEEPGESLHGSDDEKEQVSDDEYEVDNSVFVPHGYLSDDEGDADESNNQVLSPETQKAKLKLLGEEFEAQMKSGTNALKPLIIFLTATMQANACKLGSSRYQKLLERRAVWPEENGPILLSQHPEKESSDLLAGSMETSTTGSCGPGAKRRKFSEEAMPALITLVHGNLNKRPFLVKEFASFLQQCTGEKDDETQAEGSLIVSFSNHQGSANEQKTPRKSSVNPLVQKWSPLPQASKICISDKIKEIAVWKPSPDEGLMHNRFCWYVPKEIREQYGLIDLKLPNNSWIYTLKPKVTIQSGSPSNACVTSSGEPKAALITKFTKVMTPEEKQKEWDSLKSLGQSSSSQTKSTSIKSSAGKITAFTSQVKSHENLEKSLSVELTSQQVSSHQPLLKKRVPLLVSVPRGQQIISGAHCSLLSKFEATAKSPCQTKVNDESKQSDIECVTLD